MYATFGTKLHLTNVNWAFKFLGIEGHLAPEKSLMYNNLVQICFVSMGEWNGNLPKTSWTHVPQTLLELWTASTILQFLPILKPNDCHMNGNIIFHLDHFNVGRNMSKKGWADLVVKIRVWMTSSYTFSHSTSYKWDLAYKQSLGDYVYYFVCFF